jgi:hypothetical protein
VCRRSEKKKKKKKKEKERSGEMGPAGNWVAFRNMYVAGCVHGVAVSLLLSELSCSGGGSGGGGGGVAY